MTRKLKTLLATSAILGGLAVTAALAEDNAPPSQPQGSREMMMGSDGGMMKMMGRMAPEQMQQMMRMVENCNRMMESMGSGQKQPGKDGAPDTHG